MRRRLCCLIILTLALPSGRAVAAAPLAEKYLLDGNLAEGAKILQDRLKENPNDDQARFGLGTVQFLQAFEHLGAYLHMYGLRTEKAFLRLPPQVKEFFPQNPNPETLTYPAARQIIQTFIDDVDMAEATLAGVKDPDVKMPLHVGLIKIDPFGCDKPINAAFLCGRVDGLPEAMRKPTENLVVGFRRGDVSWLRGYCHFLAAAGELLLSVDGQEAFECSAHLLFEKVETPHTFLLEDRRRFDEATFAWEDRPLLSDVISFFHHMIRLPIKNPDRTKAAPAHLEAGVFQAQQMWAYFNVEMDDDNVWIPNPKQTGVLGVKVTQEMVDSWLIALDEADSILKGKKLIPFWRGKEDGRGVNLHRVFTEPRTFDAIEWFQGTAATPYLEKGPLTKLADPRTGARLINAFGGPFNLLGFGFWFN